MGEGEHETKKTRRHDQRVRFNSACNETHLVEREVSSDASSSSTNSDSWNGSSEFSINDNDLNNSDTISLDLSSTHSSEAVYDPNRIPSSIFSSGPTNNNDWSVASNESLFSIRMGNNSFSRDHGFLVYKAGELMKLDEVFNQLPFTTLPPVDEREKGGVEEEGPLDSPPHKAENVSSDMAASPKEIKFEEHCCKPNKIADSARLSDASTASNASFAFPILINQDTKNVSNKSERAVKEDTTIPRPQQQLPKKSDQWKRSSPPPPAPPKPRTLTSWFCCFSCCSFRCSMSLK